MSGGDKVTPITPDTVVEDDATIMTTEEMRERYLTALDVLEDIMLDTTEPAAIRLLAASKVVEAVL